MANDQITGNVTGKIRFTIDKASWNNLETFQKKLTSIKKQMSNLDKTINVNAVVKSVEKIATAQVKATEKVVKVQKKAAKEGWGIEFGRATGSNKEYASWWKDTLAIQDKGLKESIRQQKNHIRQQQQMVKQANARAGMGGRLAWMFPSGGVSNKASGTLFAQMLRDEEKAGNAVKRTGAVNSPSGVGLEFGKATGADRTYAAWWNDALKAEEKALKDYDKRRERVLSTRAKLNAARRKRKGKAIDASSMFEQRVNAFMTVKENQIRNEAIRKGYSGTQQEADNLARLHKARVDNFNAVYGNIGQFRANLNGVVNGMHTVQRAAAANKITFASLRGELVQLTAAYGAFAVTQNVAQTGMKLEGIRAAAKVFAGDEAGTREHMAYLVAMSDRLGVNFMVAAQEFNKFSIAVGNKANKGTQRHIFEALSEYATVLQVDQQQYERAIRSVVQMFSKEQVYA